jgi:DNA-binding HxlR family transcriptional regulator
VSQVQDISQATRAHAPGKPNEATCPQVEELVTEIIGRVADKWTMVLLETLEEAGELRFSRIAAQVGGISQKMLTKTLRQMERDGLLTRTIYPVVPPHVEYRLTELGRSLSAAFCGVWHWAEEHHLHVAQARRAFDEQLRQATLGGSVSE